MIAGIIIGVITGIIVTGVFLILTLGSKIENYYDKKDNDNDNP